MNEEFNDPRLAVIYDRLNPWGADNEFYRSLLRGEDAAVLDLGCGTGAFACACAADGRAVVGVDPADAMLDVARAKPHAEKVEWVRGDARTWRSDRRFDLIVMTGHAFQVLLTDRDVDDALATMKLHVAPGGRVAFETRNPARREWDEWTPERSRESITVDEVGRIDVWTSVDAEQDDRVRFTMHFRFRRSDCTLTSTSTLRFLDRAALERHLADAGLAIEAIYGDWDRREATPASPEIIVVAGI